MHISENPKKVEVIVLNGLILGLSFADELRRQIEWLTVIARNRLSDLTIFKYRFNGPGYLRLSGFQKNFDISDTAVKFEDSDKLIVSELAIRDGVIYSLTLNDDIDIEDDDLDVEKIFWIRFNQICFGENKALTPSQYSVAYVDSIDLRDIEHAVGYIPDYR